MDPDNLSGVAVPDLLNLPKSGKSARPDHRMIIALYLMLAYLTPASTVSSAKPGVRRAFCGLAGCWIRLFPRTRHCRDGKVPEARATAAKALGTLVECLGEIHFPDLVPGLLRTLKKDTSGVDRQGAAQGLSEVLSGLGMERLEGLLPDIIANARSPRPTVREGFMSLLVFLPATFGSRFQPHLPRSIRHRRICPC